MLGKAEKSEIFGLEESIRGQFQNMQDFGDSQSKIKVFLKDIKDDVDNKVSIEEFNKYLAEVVQKVDKNFSKTSLNKDCQRDRTDLTKVIEKNRGEHDKLSKIVKKYEGRIG